MYIVCLCLVVCWYLEKYGYFIYFLKVGMSIWWGGKLVCCDGVLVFL